MGRGGKKRTRSMVFASTVQNPDPDTKNPSSKVVSDLKKVLENYKAGNLTEVIRYLGPHYVSNWGDGTALEKLYMDLSELEIKNYAKRQGIRLRAKGAIDERRDLARFFAKEVQDRASFFLERVEIEKIMNRGFIFTDDEIRNFALARKTAGPIATYHSDEIALASNLDGIADHLTLRAILDNPNRDLYKALRENMQRTLMEKLIPIRASIILDQSHTPSISQINRTMRGGVKYSTKMFSEHAGVARRAKGQKVLHAYKEGGEYQKETLCGKFLKIPYGERRHPYSAGRLAPYGAWAEASPAGEYRHCKECESALGDHPEIQRELLSEDSTSFAVPFGKNNSVSEEAQQELLDRFWEHAEKRLAKASQSEEEFQKFCRADSESEINEFIEEESKEILFTMLEGYDDKLQRFGYTWRYLRGVDGDLREKLQEDGINPITRNSGETKEVDSVLSVDQRREILELMVDRRKASKRGNWEEISKADKVISKYIDKALRAHYKLPAA